MVLPKRLKDWREATKS